MARELGLSLTEVDALTNVEYRAWLAHLSRYPSLPMLAAAFLKTKSAPEHRGDTAEQEHSPDDIKQLGLLIARAKEQV